MGLAVVACRRVTVLYGHLFYSVASEVGNDRTGSPSRFGRARFYGDPNLRKRRLLLGNGVSIGTAPDGSGGTLVLRSARGCG